MTTRNDQQVWVANLGATTQIFTRVDWNAPEDEKVDLSQRTKDGAFIPGARYPARVTSAEYKRKVRPIFVAGGNYGVTEPVAEIMRGMDMGKNALHPFDYVDLDGETPMAGGPFYFLNICEFKTAIDVSRSGTVLAAARHIRRPEVVVRLSLIGLEGPDKIAVTQNALHGPDMWMDSQLQLGVFFSDRLVGALRAAKLVKRIQFHRCHVLPAAALH